MKKFFAEFKEFISKGDVMSMAVGIIVGGAFTAIVSSLVADVITPLIGIIVGGINLSGIVINVGEAQLLIGNFLQAIINFLLTAFVLFLVVKALNKFNRKKEAPQEEAPKEPEIPADIALLTEIRDLLKK